MKENAGDVAPVIPFTTPRSPSLGSSEDIQLRGHLFMYFPPHRSTGETYPGAYLGSAWCRAQPRSLGTQGAVSRLHDSPCGLVGFYHLVPEDTTVLFYLLHKAPSSPLKIPAKVSFMHFLANPQHNWPDWFEDPWWPRASLFEDNLSQGMGESVPRPAWLCTVRCPSCYPPSLESSTVILLCPAVPPGRVGGITLEEFEGI